jgi:hypothetical protein
MGQVVASTGRATLRQSRIASRWEALLAERKHTPEIDQPRDARTDLIARKHPIDQTIVLTQRVKSIELFQSPRPGGSGYQVLASLRPGEVAGSASTPSR